MCRQEFLVTALKVLGESDQMVCVYSCDQHNQYEHLRPLDQVDIARLPQKYPQTNLATLNEAAHESERYLIGIHLACHLLKVARKFSYRLIQA